MSSESLKNVIKKYVYESYIFNIYVKKDLAFNNQQGLICHKNQPNQIYMNLINIKRIWH